MTYHMRAKIPRLTASPSCGELGFTKSARGEENIMKINY
jgi:hypothetical protein